MKTTPDQFLSEIQPVRRELEQWRRSRSHGRKRIPAELWTQMSRIARAYGVSRAARALGVQFYALRKHAGASAALPLAQPASPHCQFIELALPAAAGGCVIELEDRSGAKMTVRLPHAAPADAAALVEAFWRGRP